MVIYFIIFSIQFVLSSIPVLSIVNHETGNKHHSRILAEESDSDTNFDNDWEGEDISQIRTCTNIPFMVYKKQPVPRCCEFTITNQFYSGRLLNKYKTESLNQTEVDEKVPEFKIKRIKTDLLKKKDDSGDVFVRKIRKFLKIYYSLENETVLLNKILKMIYKRLHNNFNSLIIFMSHAIFNTSGFKYLVNVNDDSECCYKSRGLLQITGEANYKILDNISKTSHWSNYPGDLGYLSVEAVNATLIFWKYYVFTEKNMTFETTLEILNPEEARKFALLDKNLEERYLNRYWVYKTLIRIFGNGF